LARGTNQSLGKGGGKKEGVKTGSDSAKLLERGGGANWLELKILRENENQDKK